MKAVQVCTLCIPHAERLVLRFFLPSTHQGARPFATLTRLSVSSISDSDAGHLGNLKQLRSLTITRGRVTGAALVHMIGCLPNLEHLAVYGCR